MKRFIPILLFTFVYALNISAQIKGKIVDEFGFPLSKASASYKGHHIAVASDDDGLFTIARHEGWTLTFSCVGFKSQTLKIDASTPNELKIQMKEDSRSLQNVDFSAKRGKYSRKNNPAVELMQRVIEMKKRTDLENHDYYQYNKYQKISLLYNNIQQEDLDSGFFKKMPTLRSQIETSPYNGKLTLPLMVDETVTQHVFRKDPRSEKDIIKGQKSEGINTLLQTGEMLNTVLKDVFTDVDIYDDHIRLLQFHFPSPIGRTAISFYRYYIEDTVYVDRDLCYHLQFIPNNQQDFGFRGELYVLADSTLHVKRCEMTLPKKTGVNFVDDIQIKQEFTRLDNGEWVLTADDMIVELKLNKHIKNGLVTRITRLSDYDFEEINKKLFKGKAAVKHEADAQLRDDDFWNKYRTVELTKGESSMNAFIHRIEQSKNFKWVMFGVRALVENYVETGTSRTKSKFDIGPVTTLISSNFVDGYRLRASGRTTAHLNPHWFWSGFYAYGLKSKKHYYNSELVYSFTKKKNASFEFPSRNIIFESSYDVMSPSDKFLIHNKDNMFMTLRTQKVEEMYFYNRQKLSFVWETEGGFGFTTSLKAESNESAGDLHFFRMPNAPLYSQSPEVHQIRTTEWQVKLRYAPGETFINTKQKRWPINLDAPIFTVTHTMGFKGFLGGQYKLNYTELGIYKRFWLGSWGYLDNHINAGAQWNKVPFPLLIMPPSNVTYLEDESTFSLMRNMEFINDRYAFWSIAWNMNGKIFNRIPLIKHLKCREYIAFKGMFGTVTDKNNPLLAKNQADARLFQFPKATHLLEKGKPYMELVVGVNNIFKFLTVDYVRRLTYTDLLDAPKHGIRFFFLVSF